MRKSEAVGVLPALELVRFEFRTGERGLSVGGGGDLQAALKSGDWPVTYM